MKRKSTGDYPANWAEIASECKRRANWRCIRCNADNDAATGYVLTVHHLDINPANCAWWNLAALCQRCHLHIQSKVVMERYYFFEHSEWFKPYVAGYYANMHGHPDDYDWVITHLEPLLEYGRPPFTSSLGDQL